MRGAQAALEKAQPFSNFMGGAQSGQQLMRGDLQNQQLQQNVDQQAALAPLQQRALEQGIETGDLQNQTLQASLDALGVPDEATAKQVALNVATIAGLPTAEAKLAKIKSLKEIALKNNRTTENLDELEAAYMQDPAAGDALVNASIGAFQQTGFLSEIDAQLMSAGEAEFESLIKDFSPEDQVKARRVKSGLDPRAVGSGNITTATTEGLTDQVADSQATIKQRGKFAELTGASRAKAIDSGFSKIQNINSNIGNIDRAISAIDEGASTGAIESRFFPTIRSATVKLEQIQKELGLDIIGAVSFGALSEGELQLALNTALPTNLEPKELKKFLEDKRQAQSKLRDYYKDQINFLDSGGTLAGYLRSKERDNQQQPQGSTQTQSQTSSVGRFQMEVLP
jgi:uncharacterized protein YpiB (UPF0302 family)